MTASLSTISCSETEFPLTGQLAKVNNIHNVLLTTAQSIRNLGFIIHVHLSVSVVKSFSYVNAPKSYNVAPVITYLPSLKTL